MSELELLGKNAKKAAEKLLSATESLIDRALLLAARLLRENSEMLKARNAEDVSNAEKKGKSAAFIDRLKLTDKVISGMAEGIEQVASLKSPVGKEIYTYFNKEQDIKISKKNVPFGVIGIIFESRPNVTADAFALCLKTGNSVILRGGSDSLISNKAIVSLLRRALKECGIDENAVSLIEDTSHETAEKFMKLDKYVDLIIPRGGASLIKIPRLGHLINEVIEDPLALVVVSPQFLKDGIAETPFDGTLVDIDDPLEIILGGNKKFLLEIEHAPAIKRLLVVRIDGENRVVVGNGLLDLAHLGVECRPVLEDKQVLRLLSQCRVIGYECLLGLAHTPLYRSQIHQ